MAKRLTRKLTDVAAETQATMIKDFEIKAGDIDRWRQRAQSLDLKFPVSSMSNINDLWIDYEVQRDVLVKHVINICRKWDPRICSPVSAAKIAGKEHVETYDGQHRTLAAAILGFETIPCSIVETTDPNFASYAFEMLNDTGVKRLGPGDLHRNALVRYRNGSREIKNVLAFNMQSQFDNLGIDLEDKNTRKSDKLRGDNAYFFSHFKYADKAVKLDNRGQVLYSILNAVKTTWPDNEEIDQGVFIGLYELHRLAGSAGILLPENWMTTLCDSIAKVWNDSSVVHAKGRAQWAFYKGDGSTWTAPTAMSNFLREVHMVRGGKLKLPFHGDGSKMGIEEGVVAPGLGI